MDSIDKLREYGHDCCARIDDAIHDLADAIEAEIADRYVALPLDADGVPIRVDDVMEGWGSFEYHDLMEQPVESMVLHDRGRWEVYCDYVSTWNPSKLRHHHALTVEDVLREFAEEYAHDENGVESLLVEKYAAKLRLAGDGE